MLRARDRKGGGDGGGLGRPGARGGPAGGAGGAQGYRRAVVVGAVGARRGRCGGLAGAGASEAGRGAAGGSAGRGGGGIRPGESARPALRRGLPDRRYPGPTGAADPVAGLAQARGPGGAGRRAPPACGRCLSRGGPAQSFADQPALRAETVEQREQRRRDVDDRHRRSALRSGRFRAATGGAGRALPVHRCPTGCRKARAIGWTWSAMCSIGGSG